MFQRDAIKKFLTDRTWPDLANLYSPEMEVQVNVAQDNGTRVDGEYKGKHWLAWTDGLNTWKSFRIPYKANTEPEYTDKNMSFDLYQHAEGVGMTGWNWVQRRSEWVAYDFDAITGHSDKHNKKLSDSELNHIREIIKTVPWVSLRTSTSGKGLHVYVQLGTHVATRNHHEHAALARAILSMLSATTTFDFNNKVDTCGGNMWVWHRKKTVENNGLSLIKQGEPLTKIPENWIEHLSVIRGKTNKIKASYNKQTLPENPLAQDDLFEELTGQRSKTPLDSEHKRLMDYLNENNCRWWWDQDHWMLVTHTTHLKEAHNKLNLRGVFETISTGTEAGIDHNCFAYPLAKGAWSVRRYSEGTQETNTWQQDGKTWTQCFLNRDLDLITACKLNGGIEHPKGGWHFDTMEKVIKTLTMLNAKVSCNANYYSRSGLIKEHKEDGKIVVSMSHTKDDTHVGMEGWIRETKNWVTVVNICLPVHLETESNLVRDEIVRHLVTPDGVDCGWMLRAEGHWNDEPLVHIRAALDSLGFNKDEKTSILGENLFKPWRLVNRPFQAEYPGDRTWNRNAAQLTFTPSPELAACPTWDSVLEHCGANLDDACLTNPWCKTNGIVKGSEYLRCWIASLIKDPNQPLPYLFFYSRDQNTGKSTFHEALELLLTTGCIRADVALTSSGGFNGEFENCVLCVVEETDLKNSKQAYAKIKDWVTSPQILIHRKTVTPYMAPNSTHWIQCANDPSACPVFPGDTRITMIKVDPLKNEVAKKELIKQLKKEAPDFLAHIFALELPPSGERLNIPILVTDDKLTAEAVNKDELNTFIDNNCFVSNGSLVKFSDFYPTFIMTLRKERQEYYSKTRVSLDFPNRFPKGKITSDPNIYIGNMTFDFSKAQTVEQPYVKVGEYLKK